MLSFIGKFTKDDKIVAWRISDDGVEYNIAAKAPYHEFYFQSMIDSGYKFHDYNGNITTPDGYPLDSVVESTEYLSDTDLIDLIDAIDVGMLEEREIVQNFDRNVEVQYVEVLNPVDPIIDSREEFVSYLDMCISAKARGIHRFSNKPVNAIATKESLYTLEEIAANTNDARTKFIRMFDSHIMSSINDLHLLKETYGVKDAMSETEKMVAILKGFFAFGVPGINAKITNIRYDVSPTESYKDLKQSMNNSALLKYGIRRNADYKFYSEDISGRDYGTMAGDEDFDSNAYLGGSSVTSIKPEPISAYYTVAAYGYKKAAPRIIVDMLSEDGIKATFIADCNEAHLYRGYEEMLSTLRMFNYLTVDNVYIPMSRIVMNGESYIADSVLIRAYISDQIKKSTITPKYPNSFKLMTGIGVSPYYAPMYINRMIRDGIDTQTDIANIPEFTRLHYFCSDTFRDGFSNYILEKYGTGGEDFFDRPISEQIEMINEEVSNLMAEGKYLVKPEIPEGTMKLASTEYNDWFDEFNANEIGNVNFVLSLLNGEQNIGRMAVGMLLDSNSNDFKNFNIMYGGYVAAKENNPQLSCQKFLLSEDIIAEYIDLDILFKKRRQTALGCAKDITLFRSDMAFSSNTLLYITKVFRENGNQDLESVNRHYGFECFAFDKSPSSRGSQIYNSIYNQIVDDLQKKGLSDCMSIAGDASAMIIMGIISSQDEVIPIDGICNLPYRTTLQNGIRYEVSVKLGESYYRPIRSGQMFQRKYTSNYDFCENQFSKANMKCDYYCVNASVNPWIVTPRAGFKINEYNLFVNYFKIEELDSNYPASVIDRIKQTGAKVFNCLRETFTSNELFPSMPSVFSKSEEIRLAQEGFFLDRRETEDLESYMTRTIHDIRKEKSEGRALKNTYLKSDLEMGVFKPYVYIDGTEDDNWYFSEFAPTLTNRHVSAMSPRVLTEDWINGVTTSNLALTSGSKNVTMERINFSEISLDAKVWNKKLLLGSFSNTANVYISRARINYNGGKYKIIAELDDTQMAELCSEGIAIQLDSTTYVIKTINGLIKVGV